MEKKQHQDDRIDVTCPSCEARYRVPSRKRGKRSRCKRCEASFIVFSDLDLDRHARGEEHVEVACPYCDRHYQAKRRKLGRAIHCKGCTRLFRLVPIGAKDLPDPLIDQLQIQDSPGGHGDFSSHQTQLGSLDLDDDIELTDPEQQPAIDAHTTGVDSAHGLDRAAADSGIDLFRLELDSPAPIEDAADPAGLAPPGESAILRSAAPLDPPQADASASSDFTNETEVDSDVTLPDAAPGESAVPTFESDADVVSAAEPEASGLADAKAETNAQAEKLLALRQALSAAAHEVDELEQAEAPAPAPSFTAEHADTSDTPVHDATPPSAFMTSAQTETPADPAGDQEDADSAMANQNAPSAASSVPPPPAHAATPESNEAVDTRPDSTPGSDPPADHPPAEEQRAGTAQFDLSALLDTVRNPLDPVPPTVVDPAPAQDSTPANQNDAQAAASTAPSAIGQAEPSPGIDDASHTPADADDVCEAEPASPSDSLALPGETDLPEGAGPAMVSSEEPADTEGVEAGDAEPVESVGDLEAPAPVAGSDEDSLDLETRSAPDPVVPDVAAGQDSAKPKRWVPTLHYNGHIAPVTAIAMTPDGKHLAAGDARGELRLWDVSTHNLVQTRQVMDGPIWQLAFHDNQLLSIAGDGAVSCRNLFADHHDPIWLEAHPSGITALDTADREGEPVLLTAGKDRIPQVWSLRRRAVIRRLVGHRDRVSAAKLSPDGNTAVTASWDGSIRVWCTSTGAQEAVLHQNDRRWLSLEVDWSAQVVWGGSQDGVTVRWCWASDDGADEVKTHDAPIAALLLDQTVSPSRMLCFGSDKCVVALPTDGKLVPTPFAELPVAASQALTRVEGGVFTAGYQPEVVGYTAGS